MAETWNWPPEKLYRALCTVFDENDDVPPVHRDIAKRKLAKLKRQGKLHFENLHGDWVWRLCCAELMHHEYHWFGWEKRSEWCWELCTKQWFYPRWDGLAADLLVVGEQGIGDEILFASCYADLLSANFSASTTIEVDHRLLAIMRRSFPKAVFTTRYRDDARRVPWQNTDYRGPHGAFIPAGNVVKLFRKKVGDFPQKAYLVPDPEKVERYSAWLAQFPRPWVGVSWKGHTTRYIEPGRLLPRAGTAINLQYNGCNDALVQPPCDLRVDVDDVFALVAALDWVNCCPVWVAHVAGSIKKMCNVVRAPRTYGVENNIMRWEFGMWDRCDWYGDMTLYPSVERFEEVKK